MTTEAIPLVLLTGFLGSGKTTILRHALANPEFSDAAVLINEFGEVGLDHLLVRALTESAVLLSSGCVCCSIRGDLSAALIDLLTQRDCGKVPPFRRVIIETTGLADPAPVIATVLSHPALQYHFRIDTIAAAIDGVLGAASLDRHPELVKQAAVASQLILTKADLADSTALASLRERLRRLNPLARIGEAVQGRVETSLLEDWRRPNLAAGFTDSVRRTERGRENTRDHLDGRSITSFVITVEEPIEWTALGLWLSLLVHGHGAALLRIKGILNLQDSELPVVLQGVQHLIHPPEHLARWPSDDRRSQMVFIGVGLDRERIERSFRTFLRLGNRVSTGRLEQAI